MKLEIKIPKGWRLLKVGAVIRKGDRISTPVTHRGWTSCFACIGEAVVEADAEEGLFFIRKIGRKK